MKKIFFAVVAIALLAVSFSLFAQFSGPPTAEQLQQLMQQMGAPEGMTPDGTIPNGTNFGPPANVLEMQNKGLKQLQRSAKNMLKAIAQMEKAIAGATKAGFPPAQDIIDATAKGKAAVQIIQDATEFSDDVQDAIDQFNDFADVMDANIEPLNMLANFPRIQRQAVREMANLDKAFEKVKVKVASAEMDLSYILADIQGKIGNIKAVYDNALAYAKAGQAAEAFDMLENDFFPTIGDTRQAIGMLDALKNISRAAKSVDKGIKGAEKIVAKLQKKKLDVSSLNTIIADSKSKLDELRAALKSSDFDPTTAVDYLENLNELRDQFESAVDTVVGDTNVGTLPQVDFFGATMPKVPNFNVGGGAGVEKIDLGF